jgi:DNA (cytosine-5)-methyltransferase 1
VEPALREILQSGPERPEGPASFTFVDLFAGIGGMRSGFESAGGRCVFTSEWNQWAQKTYRENFGIEDIAGDITKIPGMRFRITMFSWQVFPVIRPRIYSSMIVATPF